MKLLDEPPLDAQPAYRRRTPNSAPGDDSLGRLTRLFRLLAEPTRLRILYLLLQSDECHVRALCESLGQSQPAVSHHLAQLRAAGLIDCRRQGKHNFYRLTTRACEDLLAHYLKDRPSARRIRLGKYLLTCQEQG